MMLVSFTACLYLPWWSIAFVCFLISFLIPQRAGLSLLCGFISLFLLWFGLSFYISNNNEHILAHKVSLMILKIDNPVYLTLLTGIIGGLTGGLASVSGSLARPKSKTDATA
jgi:hypothetical protein